VLGQALLFPSLSRPPRVPASRRAGRSSILLNPDLRAPPRNGAIRSNMGRRANGPRGRALAASTAVRLTGNAMHENEKTNPPHLQAQSQAITALKAIFAEQGNTRTNPIQPRVLRKRFDHLAIRQNEATAIWATCPRPTPCVDTPRDLPYCSTSLYS
jgi:hypothetical protein